MVKYLIVSFCLLTGCVRQPRAYEGVRTDPTAEKMLLYQRDNGGWPQYGGDPTDYQQPISSELRKQLIADKKRLDATIDDQSTTGEIAYLLKAFQRTDNRAYLAAAEHGIAYLLEAQNEAGGWPQFYPDTSHYRKHITYNDDAMADVLNILKRTADHDGAFAPVAHKLKKQADAAVRKGIGCILRTQIRQNGRLTVWCAQHDSRTLEPAWARAFEPPSLSGRESVGVVRFLMSIENPSVEVRQAVQAAVAWFEQVRIDGLDIRWVNGNTGRDRVIVTESGSSLWARFYELGTNRPIFTGRDGLIRYAMEDIEQERRVGYAFYGKWPAPMLEKEYPAWLLRWAR